MSWGDLSHFAGKKWNVHMRLMGVTLSRQGPEMILILNTHALSGGGDNRDAYGMNRGVQGREVFIEWPVAARDKGGPCLERKESVIAGRS